MSSIPSPGAAEADTDNRLLSRMGRRRLDIEEVRDAMLAIDGSLDLTMRGTLQSGFGTDGENNQGRLSINPEKEKRRTVYLPLRRANLPTLLNLFDFGDATTVTGRRTATNVAPQALFMMNSEFVTERTRNLASQISKQLPDHSGQAGEAYLRVLNRQVTPEELDAAVAYLAGYGKRFGTDAGAALESLCRVLIASNDFIYVD
jgi:hypothetical protein